MLAGYGWCVLRSSREPYQTATVETVEVVDDQVRMADKALWAAFRLWIAAHGEDFLKWTLHEHLNNHSGILQYCVSRNHRSSCVWDMIEWIAENGPGSYGLLYVHDDEDGPANTAYQRGMNDFTNAFHVHRVANGKITELDDPFLSPIVSTIDPTELA